MALDPVRETELLGDSGEYLAPLIAFDEQVQPLDVTLQDVVSNTAEVIDPDLYGLIEDYPATQPHNRGALWGQYGISNPYVGYLRHTHSYPPITFNLGVQPVSVEGEEGPLTTTSWDMGSNIHPFVSGDLSFPWPGQETEEPVVSAIRVRVAGLEGLSRDDAIDEVAAVARQIRSLGLDATVVAGASQTQASIFVPRYAFGPDDPEGEQVVDELGWLTHDVMALGVLS